MAFERFFGCLRGKAFPIGLLLLELERLYRSLSLDLLIFLPEGGLTGALSPVLLPELPGETTLIRCDGVDGRCTYTFPVIPPLRCSTYNTVQSKHGFRFGSDRLQIFLSTIWSISSTPPTTTTGTQSWGVFLVYAGSYTTHY